jgi:hypothetical protein
MSSERHDPKASIPGKVAPIAWSDNPTVDYETALQLVGRVVAAYDALITREQAAPGPDVDAIRNWTKAKDGFVARRDTLRVGDTAEVSRIRAECSELITELGAPR